MFHTIDLILKQSILSTDSCMKFLSQNVTFGNPWEGGYDVCIACCKSTVQLVMNSTFLAERDMQIHSREHGSYSTRSALPSHWSFWRWNVYIARLCPSCAQPAIHRNTYWPHATYTSKDYSGFSNSTLDELTKMYTQTIVPTTVAWYSLSTFVYWIFLYFSAKLVHFGFNRSSSQYRQLSYENRASSVVCEYHRVMMQILY